MPCQPRGVIDSWRQRRQTSDPINTETLANDLPKVDERLARGSGEANCGPRYFNREKDARFSRPFSEPDEFCVKQGVHFWRQRGGGPLAGAPRTPRPASQASAPGALSMVAAKAPWDGVQLTTCHRRLAALVAPACVRLNYHRLGPAVIPVRTKYARPAPTS